ncbi:MAG: aldo/keto reductase [Alphaproteobacteria bacterium]
MRRRPFGRTGLEAPELVLGGGIVGGILILAEEAVRGAALERTVAAGIDWIDTAAQYGNGVSEETIGRWLRRLSPRPRVSTKFRLKPGDLFDIRGAVERCLEASLKRLGLDRIVLFQLHNQLGGADPARALPVEHVLRREGVADALDALKARGLIDATGFTALGETHAVMQVADSGRFDSAQVYYNMLNPSAAWSRAPAGWPAQDFSGLIAACRRHGTAVMNIRAMAGGALASPEPHGREVVIALGADLDRDFARAARVRAALGTDFGTPAQAALRFALANPDIACVDFGIATLAHLDEALAAYALGPLPDEAMRRLEPLWATDFGLA